MTFPGGESQDAGIHVHHVVVDPGGRVGEIARRRRGAHTCPHGEYLFHASEGGGEGGTHSLAGRRHRLTLGAYVSSVKAGSVGALGKLLLFEKASFSWRRSSGGALGQLNLSTWETVAPRGKQLNLSTTISDTHSEDKPHNHFQASGHN